MTTGPAADEDAPAEFDTAEFDIVVAGSGAAGMTAALTAAHLGASVVVLEKTGAFGGSTARSGGGIWAPGNAVLRRAGVADTPELARAYLAHVTGGARPGGAAARAARALPGHARPRPGDDAAALHVGARLRRLLSRGTRRAGVRAQHRAGAARRDRARRRARPAEPALPAGPRRRRRHPGRLPLAEPRPPAPARRPGRRAGRGPAGAHPPARAPDAQPRPGAGRGAAGRAARQRRAGVAEHAAGRPGHDRRQGDRGPRGPRTASRC